MKNLCRYLIVTSLCLFSSVSTSAQQTAPPPPPPPKPNSTLQTVWQELVVPAGNFKIEFPGKPVEQTQTVKTAAGNFPLHIFLSESGGTAYLASYVDFPIVVDSPASIKSALDNGRDSMMARKDASLISEKEITYGLYPGREIRAKLGNFTAQTSLYLVKQRLYNLSAFAPAELADIKEVGSAVQRFLGSFKLLEVPKLPENAASLSAALDNIQTPPPDFFARPAAWQELTSPEFGFKITIPSAPFRQTVALGPNLTDVKVNLWLAKGDDVFCTVVHQGLVNPPKDERAAELLLNSVIGGMIETDQIQIVSQTPRSLDGHPGRELKLQMGNTGTGRGRAYIVGKNVYAFLAISLGEKPNDQAVARVLDSFKLTSTPGK